MTPSAQRRRCGAPRSLCPGGVPSIRLHRHDAGARPSMSERAGERTVSLIWKLMAIVAGSFGFGFALVPLYNVLCSVTGLGNQKSLLQRGRTAIEHPDPSRTVTVEFIADSPTVGSWRVPSRGAPHRCACIPGSSTRLTSTRTTSPAATRRHRRCPTSSPSERRRLLPQDRMLLLQPAALRSSNEERVTCRCASSSIRPAGATSIA